MDANSKNTLIKLVFFKVSHRTSTAVECIYIDPINAVVELAWAKGSIYRYTSVSRRAILNLMINPLISLGLWANHNLTFTDSKCKKQGTCTKLHPMDAVMNQQLPWVY